MIRNVRESDLTYLAEHLRGADRIELLAASGSTDVEGALRGSYQMSDYVKVGVDPEDKPVIIWGMTPVKSIGIIWAVATPAIKTNRQAFLRNCRGVIQHMFDTYPVNALINFTHGENTLHHRWLKWCGAELLPEVPYGPNGEPFRPFVIRRGTNLV